MIHRVIKFVRRVRWANVAWLAVWLVALVVVASDLAAIFFGMGQWTWFGFATFFMALVVLFSIPIYLLGSE